jgi:hypothetical protein
MLNTSVDDFMDEPRFGARLFGSMRIRLKMCEREFNEAPNLQ